MSIWEPFRLCGPEERAPAPRSIRTNDGIGDRLRAAAFAELQASKAFLRAAGAYDDAPAQLRRDWRGLAAEEEKHLGWLLGRMASLGVDVRERAVSDRLWRSLAERPTARDFGLYMAEAEERGRRAGLRFFELMAESDPATARLFWEIAEEETAHIALARKHFGEVLRPGQNR